jgi:hypothetical protein
MANLCTLFILYKTFTELSRVVYIALTLKTAPKSNTINI